MGCWPVKITMCLQYFFIDRVKYQKTSGQGSNLKATMKLSKTNLKQLQRVNHPDKNYMLEKFLSQSNKSEVGWTLWKTKCKKEERKFLLKGQVVKLGSAVGKLHWILAQTLPKLFKHSGFSESKSLMMMVSMIGMGIIMKMMTRSYLSCLPFQLVFLK